MEIVLLNGYTMLNFIPIFIEANSSAFQLYKMQ